jgi:hypothetical protein
MHIIAFLLALAAVVLFLVEWYAITPRRPIALAWALLTIAWMVQLIILNGSKITVD